MKVLVTGGAGFIGSHLCERLINEGNDVVCIDNLSIGNKANIADLLKNNRFKFYFEDLCNFEKVNEIFEIENIDTVYHLAANSDIKKSAGDPKIEYSNTFTSTFSVLNSMRLYGVKKLFFASTSAVYGDKEGSLVAEDTPGLMPISYYGGAKFASEAFISAFSYMNDLEVLIFRFPNVIGPKLTHGVIFDFINKLRINPHELEILGDGSQIKPYMYVGDLVDAIQIFMKKVTKGVKIYNIGVDTATSVNEIASLVIKHMGLTNVKISYTGGKTGWKGDVSRFSFDLSKIRAEGYSIPCTSTQAVERTVRELTK